MQHTQTQIATVLGVHKSTIGRELLRNCGRRGYRPRQAHQKAMERRQHKAKHIVSAEKWLLIESKLRLDWSPEQITGWLNSQNLPAVSHETIHQHVYADKQGGGDLYKHLRCQKKCRKRYGRYDCRGEIPARRGIEARPGIVDLREHLGDWEMGTLIGISHQGVLVTVSERKSRFTLLRQVSHKSADRAAQAVIELLGWVSHMATITADNGKEFAAHRTIAHKLDAEFYFAHPYAAWERGTNENTNGLIRQYIPKDRNLTAVTAEKEVMIMDRLNLRPRKCLNFRTPFEEFFGQSIALTT
ncbi:MAG: IS30 family transposase [Anaerolineaceae bacterium]|nr:IS30 family transposase [Anaerolineaceae bacterium]